MPVDHLQTCSLGHKPVQLSRQCLPGIYYLSHFQAVSSPQEVYMALQDTYPTELGQPGLGGLGGGVPRITPLNMWRDSM